MACHLDGTKPLSKPINARIFFIVTLGTNLSEILTFNIWENALENVVCEMVSICLDLNVLMTFSNIFFDKNFCVLIQIFLKSVPGGLIEKRSASVQVMAWRRTGDKPLPKPMMTHFTDACMAPATDLSELYRWAMPTGQAHKSHNAPVPYRTFLFRMVYFGIWGRCVVGFVRTFYYRHRLRTELSFKSIFQKTTLNFRSNVLSIVTNTFVVSLWRNELTAPSGPSIINNQHGDILRGGNTVTWLFTLFGSLLRIINALAPIRVIGMILNIQNF